MELRHLRHLLAVAEHGNFSRAADAVYLTQPALSRSIQALEAAIGALVFERNRGALEPTEIGRLLLRHAQSLDASLRDLDREIRMAKGLELGELRIGVGPFGGAVLVGPVVGRLNRLHPRLRLRLTVAPWQELPERARSREVDLVVAELSELQLLDDFTCQPLSVHRSDVVCRKGHPLTRLANPRPQDMFAYPLAGPRLPPQITQKLLAAMPAAAREAMQRLGLMTIECDSSSVLERVLAESDAISNMPRFMSEAEVRAGVMVRVPQIDLGLQVRFGAAWLKQRTMSGAALKFVELLCEHDAAIAEPPRRAAARRAKAPAPQARASRKRGAAVPKA